MSPNPAFDAAAELMALAAQQPEWRTPADTPAPASAARFRVLTDAESDALPPPAWLVDGLILKGAVNVIYGPGGVGKSFITVDLALSLAAGQSEWFGRSATPGPVVYIAAEAPEEVAQRKRAWKAARQQPQAPDFYLVPERVPLLDPTAVPDLLASLPPEAQHPALFVIDTLSRTMRGGDENGTRDMGLVFEAAEQLRDKTDAAILIIHHSGKNTANGARGSSSLTYDARQALTVSQDDGVITLQVEKHNNSPEQEPLRFVLRPSLDTCVLAPAAPGSYSDYGPLNARQWQILEAIASPSFVDGARNVDMSNHTGLSNTQISRTRDSLIKRGLVRAVGEPEHKDRRYFLTAAGQEAFDKRIHGNTVTVGNTTVTHGYSNQVPSDGNTVTSVSPPYKGDTDVTVTNRDRVPADPDSHVAGQGKSTAPPDPRAYWQAVPLGKRLPDHPCQVCQADNWGWHDGIECKTCHQRRQERTAARNGARAEAVPQ